MADDNPYVEAMNKAFGPLNAQKTEVRSTSTTGGEKGVKPERYDLIPIGPLEALARHYGRGALKYAPHQWRKGFEWSKAHNAALRHINAFWSGEDFDICPVDESGCQHVTNTGEPFVSDTEGTCYNHTGSLHLISAIWMLMALTEFYVEYPEHDDRYKSV